MMGNFLRLDLNAPRVVNCNTLVQCLPSSKLRCRSRGYLRKKLSLALSRTSIVIKPKPTQIR
jgi:hypothetical protein